MRQEKEKIREQKMLNFDPIVTNEVKNHNRKPIEPQRARAANRFLHTVFIGLFQEYQAFIV